MEYAQTPCSHSVGYIPMAQLLDRSGNDRFRSERLENAIRRRSETGLKTSHTAPGAHFWFIWRQFLGEFGSIIVKE